jgi:hypothetical protein
MDNLNTHTGASLYVENRNSIESGMNWRFTTEDARIKLKHLYPTL